MIVLVRYMSDVYTLAREGFKNSVLKFFEGTGSEHKDCYRTFKKLVRNSEYSKSYSKSDNFQKLSLLAKIALSTHNLIILRNFPHRPKLFSSRGTYLSNILERV